MQWIWPFNYLKIINTKLDIVIQQLTLIQGKEIYLMATMVELTAQVAATAAGEASAIVLINGLVAKVQELIDAGADPVALQAAVDDLKKSAQALAQAVTTEPAPVPAPPIPPVVE